MGEIIAEWSGIDIAEYGLDKHWQSVPMLDSRRILADPRLFCDVFRLR
jgi:hypothetical protein